MVAVWNIRKYRELFEIIMDMKEMFRVLGFVSGMNVFYGICLIEIRNFYKVGRKGLTAKVLILTASTCLFYIYAVLSKENSHHHHHPHHHRMSESPKASAAGNRSPSPPNSVNLTTSTNKNSLHLTHSGATSGNHAFHQFSSPHSTSTTGSAITNGSTLSGRTPSPPLNSSSTNRDGSGSSAARTSSSTSNNSSTGSSGSASMSYVLLMKTNITPTGY